MKNSDRVREELREIAPHMRLHPDVTEESWGLWMTHWGDFRAKQSKQPRCPDCGAPLRLRNGRYGDFWGCTRYPKCRYTRNIPR